ncbi:GNAT family N-acetyltransferase [Pseudoclavibacter sp. CFCC 11306]|uniref:GNAT family N-acetyltransferase n=1 Tax=Pseudoclavibacter sp. CFCC 11306 TaxID=1564493 RepID=UPI0013013671|nr:GNAT family N-acetyltransferase [Pseudoclavibacter sp. CFCC 11306]KAB1658416.1 GNAT family N-acetyltransferase [Pseudoclavibacter sp. CFCC 11306]
MSFSVKRARSADDRAACRALLQAELQTTMPLFPDEPDAQTAALVRSLGGVDETVLAARDDDGTLLGACVLRADTEVYMIIANGLDPRIARSFVSQWALLPQLAVIPEQRGTGVGRALIEAALAISSLHPSIAGVYAFAEEVCQEASEGFFAALGFTGHDTQNVTLPILAPGTDQLLPVPISHDGTRTGRYMTKSIRRDHR